MSFGTWSRLEKDTKGWSLGLASVEIAQESVEDVDGRCLKMPLSAEYPGRQRSLDDDDGICRMDYRDRWMKMWFLWTSRA